MGNCGRNSCTVPDGIAVADHPKADVGEQCEIFVVQLQQLSRNYIALSREVQFSFLPWAQTFVIAAQVENHGTSSRGPKKKNDILAMDPEMYQQMYFKDDR